MNPGYAGRPSSLITSRRCFDHLIVPVCSRFAKSCSSPRFQHRKVLAKKMTVLYKLAKEQLSKQFHYDFGLRALKSVLVMAGALKRCSPTWTRASC